MAGYTSTIKIKAIDAASPMLRHVAGEMKRFEGYIANNLTGPMATMAAPFQRATGHFARGFQQMTAMAGQLSLGLFGMGYAFKNLFLDNAVQFEVLRAQMAELYGKDGKKAMDWAMKFAIHTPMAMEGVIKSMQRLKSVGIEPMGGSLQSIVDYASKIGRTTSDELNGITLAISQMYTKGKFSGQEVLQLAERGINAYGLLSRATGKSTATLQALAQKGKLGRREIDLLIKQMGKEGAGSAQKMATTFQGLMSGLGDMWQALTIKVMDAGVFNNLKGILQSVFNQMSAFLDDPKSGTMIQNLAAGMNTFINTAMQVGTQVWPVLVEIGGIIHQIATALGGYGNLLKVILVAMAIPIVISFVSGIVALVTGLVGVIGGIVSFLAPIIGSIALVFSLITQSGLGLTVMVALAGAVGQAAAILQGIFWAVVGTIGLLVAGFTTLMVASKPFRDMFLEVLSAAWRLTKLVGGALLSGVRALFGAGNGKGGTSVPVAGKRAMGGPVSSGQTYLVGERGPELFRPGASGAIIPNNLLGSLAGGKSDITLRVVIDSPVPASVAGYQASGAPVNVFSELGYMGV